MKTGSKRIDAHSKASSMSGQIADALDHYRRKRLQEYFEIAKACKKNGVPVSSDTIEKGNLIIP